MPISERGLIQTIPGRGLCTKTLQPAGRDVSSGCLLNTPNGVKRCYESDQTHCGKHNMRLPSVQCMYHPCLPLAAEVSQKVEQAISRFHPPAILSNLLSQQCLTMCVFL